MEKRQFLDKFEELKSPVNVEMWAFLDLLLHNGKSKKEIAKALDVDISTVSRRLKRVCKHFDIKVERGGLHEDYLVNLFRTYIPDFLHSSIRDGVIDNDRPQPPTNLQNIPTTESIPELTTLEIIGRDRDLSIYPDWVDNNSSNRPQPLANPQNIPTSEPIPELTTLEFIGRDRDLTNLENLIKKQAKIVLIKAGAGVGKSTLARKFLQTQFKKVIRIEMGLESGNVTSAEEKVSQILRKDFDEEPSRDFGINLDILREKLADRANRIGVLIDNLEPALDNNYRFREKLRGYDALLAVLGDRDVCSFTLITSRRSLITPRAKVNEYSLEGLDITAWRQYFHDCENGADSEALLQMRDAYNGNAKVMDILHGAIKNRFDGYIGAYWSRYKDALLADSELETLISVEMDWLRDNQPDAYKLLCRMGCYRYQDVKTVPFEGLICLLWDVPKSRQSWVVDYLSKTSLIEFKGEYYLHPAVRDAAKSRLLDNQTDWEIANRNAAEFWTERVITIEDVDNALKACEAYNHFYEIQDYQSSGEVICYFRVSQWVSRESLAHSFHRLGLLDSIHHIISRVLGKAQNNFLLMRLSNLIGDTDWLRGNLYIAITHHEKCIYYSNQVLDDVNDKFQYMRANQFQFYSYFGIALCLIDLWEISNARDYLEQAIKLSSDFIDKYLDIQSNLPSQDAVNYLERMKNLPNEISVFLAYTYSCIEDKAMARELLEIVDSSIKPETTWDKGYSLLVRGQTHSNLQQFEEAMSFYYQAINYACESKYTQVKAKAMLGLAYIYRQKDNLKKSRENNLESIELLKAISAKPDLAEAYFQLGLTYQAMGEHDQVAHFAKYYKNKALKLFEQMEAPKQIDRVTKAFEQRSIK